MDGDSLAHVAPCPGSMLGPADQCLIQALCLLLASNLQPGAATAVPHLLSTDPKPGALLSAGLIVPALSQVGGAGAC